MKFKLSHLFYLLGGVLLLLLFVQDAKDGGDFKCFINAVHNLRDGINIYYPPIERTFLQYYYSPLFVILLVPFSFLPNFAIFYLWLLFSTWCTYRLIKIISGYVDLTLLSKKETLWLFLLTLIFTFRVIHNNFGQVQMTLFLLWGSVESIDLIRQKKNIQGAALLAFIINVKMLPLAVLAYLIYRKEFKSVLYTLLFFIVYLILPALYLGIDKTISFTIDWVHVLNPVEGTELIADKSMHSLNVLIMTLFKDGEYAFPYRRFIVDLDIKTIPYITFGVELVLMSLTLFFLKFPPFSKIKSKLSMLWETGYIFLITPLVFPHQQKYAFCYQIVPVLYLFYFLIIMRKDDFALLGKRKYKIMVSLVIISFILITLTSDLFIGRRLDDITQYFKLLTYGSLLLIIPYAMATPKYIEQYYNTKKNV